MTRRQLLAASSLLPTAAYAVTPTATLTAGDVIARIRANLGAPWRTPTVDHFTAGSEATRVTSIATTMMATYEVLKKAHARGHSLVITHEPTYYSHQDDVRPLAGDAMYEEKRAWLEKTGLAVFHLHDNWHQLPGDGIARGMARELGWERRMDASNTRTFTFEGVPLATLAQEIKTKLGVRVMRVVGAPDLRIHRAVASWGYQGINVVRPILNQSDVQLAIVGETWEWELVEYVYDLMTAGKPKALIIVGHMMSEQAGMRLFADWLRPLVAGTNVEFIAAAEPYWSPDAPVRLQP